MANRLFKNLSKTLLENSAYDKNSNTLFVTNPGISYNTLKGLAKKHGFTVGQTKSGNYVSLNVEPYGGMIMSSWLDRPLSIAGRVVVRENNELKYLKRYKLILYKPFRQEMFQLQLQKKQLYRTKIHI